MSDQPPEPRVSPVPPAERSPQVQELLAAARLPDGTDLDLVATLAHHPGLLRRWLPFGGKLLSGGRLPGRDRELLILRTAWNCRCSYEWGHHVSLAQDCGVSAAEIDEVRTQCPDATSFGAFDRTLLVAADELHTDVELSDDTWARLTLRYDVPELIELCMLVGQYHLVAFTLRSLRVAREPGVPGLPA